MIDIVKFTIGPAAGAAGVATATGYSAPVSGKVQAVLVAYSAGCPATTGFQLSDENDSLAEPVVNLANQAADRKLYPRRTIQTSEGVARTYDGANEIGEAPIIHGRLKGVLAQANPGDKVTVTVWIEA